MRYFLLLSIFTLSVLASNLDNYAKEMSFERDYKEAMNKAKKENKVLVMVLSSDYCPWCRKFERKTISSKLIHPRLSEELITLVVDNKYDKDSFPAKFQTKYTPWVYFISPKTEDIIHKTAGYVKKKDFNIAIDKAINMYKK